jgi:hypothetical protein
MRTVRIASLCLCRVLFAYLCFIIVGGVLQAGTVEAIKDIQKGVELQVICLLKENTDDLEQKQKLGFIWSEGTEYQKLKAVRDVLDGILLSEACTIGINSNKICLEIEVCFKDFHLYLNMKSVITSLSRLVSPFADCIRHSIKHTDHSL